MKTLRLLGMTLLATLFCLNFVACSSDDDDAVGNSNPNDIVGTWTGTENTTYSVEEVTVIFYEDGTGVYTSKFKERGDDYWDVESERFEYEWDRRTKDGIAYFYDPEYDDVDEEYFYIRDKRLNFDYFELEKVGYDYDKEYDDDYSWDDDYYYW